MADHASTHQRTTELLQAIASAPTKKERARWLRQFQEHLEQSELTLPFLKKLSPKIAADRRFVYELFGQWSVPLNQELIDLLLPYLRGSGRRRKMRSRLVIRLINSCTRAEQTEEIVYRYLESIPRSLWAITLLGLAPKINMSVHGSRIIKELLKQYEIRCPRCDEKLQSSQISVHLWQRHQLLYEDGKILDGWQWIQEQLADLTESSKSTHLDAIFEVARTQDPVGGWNEVERRWQALAEQRPPLPVNEGQCPNCRLTIVHPENPLPITVVGNDYLDFSSAYKIDQRGGIFSRHWQVTVRNRAVFIEPADQPPKWNGALFLLVCLGTVLLLLFAAILPTDLVLVPTLITAGLLILCFLSMVTGTTNVSNSSDIIDLAWKYQVGNLLQRRLLLADREFLASLARCSHDLGNPRARKQHLLELLEESETTPPLEREWVELALLYIRDQELSGGDPLQDLALHLGYCFAGKVTFDQAQPLWDKALSYYHSPALRLRLRILLLAEAFQEGLEPGDFFQLGKLYPTFGQIIASTHREGLARLWLLWQLRPKRLWHAVAAATSVFDLARYQALSQSLLERHPDLLLYDAVGVDGFQGQPILLCETGIRFGDALITRIDEEISWHRVSIFRKQYDVKIGDEVLTTDNDPSGIVARLQAWQQFYFEEFEPRALQSRRLKSARQKKLLEQRLQDCPTCRAQYYHQPGNTGWLVTGEDHENE
ncbi:MAG: hypothetical protein R3B84_12645 [Zavarzinella sp.]